MSRLVTEDDIVSTERSFWKQTGMGLCESSKGTEACFCLVPVRFQAVKSLNSRVIVQPEDKVALICLLESTTSVHLPRDVVPCDKFLLYCDYMNVVSTKMDLALRKKEDFSFISLSVAFEDL